MLVVILFAVAEFLYRKYIITHTIFESVKDVEFDEWLGWAPKPGRYGSHIITPDRFRKTQLDNFSPSGKKVAKLDKVISSLNIPVLNLLLLLGQDFTGRNAERKALFAEHMAASGNKWVAEKIEEFINHTESCSGSNGVLGKNRETDVE